MPALTQEIKHIWLYLCICCQGTFRRWALLCVNYTEKHFDGRNCSEKCRKCREADASDKYITLDRFMKKGICAPVNLQKVGHVWEHSYSRSSKTLPD